MKFRKKPVVIEALRYTGRGEDYDEMAKFLGAPFEEKTSAPPKIVIRTLEGTMLGEVGDWIIRGVKGEFYPCKPDIFEATYESAEPSETIIVIGDDFADKSLRKQQLDVQRLLKGE